MNLELAKLIEENLENLKQDDQHNISPAKRWELYRNFGHSRLSLFDTLPETAVRKLEHDYAFQKTEFMNFSLADYALNWLGIITARKVAHLWALSPDLTELDREECQPPDDILAIAEKALAGEVSYEKIEDTLQEIAQNLNIEICVKYEVTCAYNAAYWALTAINSSLRFLPIILLRSPNIDNLPEREQYDFATYAQKAYCVIDKNPPGRIADYYGWNVNSEDYPENNGYWYRYGELIPLEFDLQKRLEFWHWWLTEAIPQSFELAATSYAAKLRLNHS